MTSIISGFLKSAANGLLSWSLRYIGLRTTEKKSKSKDYFVNHVVLAPIWETLIFQCVLIGFPLHFVHKYWDIPWLPDHDFDLFVKWSVIIASVVISTFAFATFHRPGHFSTFLLNRRAKKMLLRMESAWVWAQQEKATQIAISLLPIAEELWAREGTNYARFLQALALYILIHDIENSDAKQHKRQANTFDQIRLKTPYFHNDILDRSQWESSGPLVFYVGDMRRDRDTTHDDAHTGPGL